MSKNRMRITERPLAFLDTETSGLDPQRHVVLEVGIVKVAPDLTVLEEYEAKINPMTYPAYSVDGDAMVVNGLDMADLIANGGRAATIGARVADMIEGCILVGHNVGFDWDFLRAWFNAFGIRYPELDYHKLDTSSMLWPLLLQGHTTSISLAKASEKLGLPYPVKHQALADAKQALALYKHVTGHLRFEPAAAA